MNNANLLSQLTTNERVLVNSEVQSKGKNMALAYYGMVKCHYSRPTHC